MCTCTHAELVQEFESALDQGLSEAVAAIQTLLQFIKNCEGMYLYMYMYKCANTYTHC